MGDLTWRDREGNEWKINEMGTSHLINCLAFMERNADAYVQGVARNLQNFAMFINGEMAFDDLCDAIEYLLEMPKAEQVDYVKQSPHYLAMWNEISRRAAMEEVM